MGPLRFWTVFSLSLSLVICVVLTGCRGLTPEVFQAGEATPARQSTPSTDEATVYVAMSSGDLIAYRVNMADGSLQEIANVRSPVRSVAKLRVALDGTLLLIGGGPGESLFGVRLTQKGTFAGQTFPLMEQVGAEFDVSGAGDLLVVSRLTPIPGKRNGRTTQSVYELRANPGPENAHLLAELDLPTCPNYECQRFLGGVSDNGSRVFIWQDETECSIASCLTYWRRRMFERTTNVLHPFTDSFASGIRLRGVPYGYQIFTLKPGPPYSGRPGPDDPYVGYFNPPIPSSQSWTCAPRSGPGWRIVHPGCNTQNLTFDPVGKTLYLSAWDSKIWSFPMKGAEPDVTRAESIASERPVRLMSVGPGYLATVEDRFDSLGASVLKIRLVDKATGALIDGGAAPETVSSYIAAVASR